MSPAREMADACDAIKRAIEDFEWSALKTPVGKYAHVLRSTDKLEPTSRDLLKLLLKHRQYDAVMEIGDAALAVAPDTPAIRLNYAQALVDSGRTAPALRMYTGIAEDPATGAADRSEARGGVGRCYKQLLLEGTNAERRTDYLQRALEAYGGLYHANRSLFWHGINATALLSYADRNSITMPGIKNSGKLASETAAEVLLTVKDLCEPDSWAIATACEAHVARGEIEEALSCAKKLVEAADANALTIGSLLRQLVSVWEIDPKSQLGTTLLPVLREAQIRLAGGVVTVDSRDTAADRLSELGNLENSQAGVVLEKVFGTERFKTLKWWRNGLLRCRAVVRIDDRNDDSPIGTGFLVAGNEIHPSLPELVVVTNCHVVPDRVKERDAVVTFHGLDDNEAGRKSFLVQRLWWRSPASPPGVDTAILELDGKPNVEPVPLADTLHLQNDKSRAYIIGHPRGYDQPQFSIQDNLLLDHDDVRLHYRSPTEGGSSGSPVFEDLWKVIGLHHAGSARMSCLTKAGTHAANEALRIDAIRAAIAAKPPEC